MGNKSVALQKPGGFNKLPLRAAYSQRSDQEQDGNRFSVFAVHPTETTEHCGCGRFAKSLHSFLSFVSVPQGFNSLPLRTKSRLAGRLATLDGGRSPNRLGSECAILVHQAEPISREISQLSCIRVGFLQHSLTPW